VAGLQAEAPLLAAIHDLVLLHAAGWPQHHALRLQQLKEQVAAERLSSDLPLEGEHTAAAPPAAAAAAVCGSPRTSNSSMWQSQNHQQQQQQHAAAGACSKGEATIITKPRAALSQLHGVALHSLSRIDAATLLPLHATSAPALPLPTHLFVLLSDAGLDLTFGCCRLASGG
jgi:hypothetical protein